MKIAIDARFLGPEGTGIGKYTEKLLENLQELDRDNEYFVILRKENFHLFNPARDNFQKILVDARYYSLKEQFFMPAVLWKIKPDLVHFPHFNVPLLYSGKFVVTIHDLIKSEFKGASSTTRFMPTYLLKHAGYEFTIRQVVRRAEKIFIPSYFVKKKLSKTFGVPNNKLVVTYEAADPVFSQTVRASEGRQRQILSTYGIKKPFILYVGAAFPYKNLRGLLESLKFLPKRIKLVYVSSRNVFVERLATQTREIGVEDRLIITGYVPNQDLAVLYKLAECFVFPSFSEGFGLPGLEAMASGCPVVCSNIPVFKEVYGDAALYFDPRYPRDIAEKIELIMKNSELRTDLIKKGLEQVKKYSWRKLAEETLKVYKELA